jgi:hypothetical protein
MFTRSAAVQVFDMPSTSAIYREVAEADLIEMLPAAQTNLTGMLSE